MVLGIVLATAATGCNKTNNVEQTNNGTDAGPDPTAACAAAAAAQCPPGSGPSVEAAVLAGCPVDAPEGLQRPAGAGEVTQVCGAAGSCRFACVFNDPCPCGVASVTSEAIACKECGGCGDGTCKDGETVETCPADCQDTCGDGQCTGDEAPATCPQDCGRTACGNGTCEAGEGNDACPADCAAACGNGDCERGETPASCPRDCGGGCEPAAERCNGSGRQVCNARGEWDDLSCPGQNICRQRADGRTECVAANQAVCDTVSFCCDGAFARNVNMACDDSQFCTEGTTCQSDGTCGGGTPTDCAGAVTEAACQAPVCDERNDRCAFEPRNEMGVCENPGTARADHCEAGQCVQDGCRCAGDNACCDGCNPRNAGMGCDDGLFCTTADTCSPLGVCQGGPARDCAAAVSVPACQVPACDDVADTCIARPARGGEACDDGLFCTEATVCQPEGTCGGGGARDCGGVVDFPTCQQAACSEEAGGCFAVAINSGMACDDGLFCFDTTTCQADGRCAGGTPVNCAAAQTSALCQAPGRCDEGGDRCVADAVNENLRCDDGSLCTQGDRCVRGACAPGAAPLCAAPGPCYAAGRCDAATGDCQNEPLPDGTPCALSNARATCQAAECAFSACLEGFDDCNGDLADGCESPTGDDIYNCGACGNDCTAGGAYLNAHVSCDSGACAFGGCASGFQDADGDCDLPGTCATGCEICEPLGDGTVDIPDDGLDNDCDGADSNHSDLRGWYVDASFRPLGLAACPGGVARGTAACPYTDLIDGLLDLQAVAQDWSRADARRFVYIAGGRYTDPGTLLDIQQPLVVAGGYTRGAGNVWRRDPAANPTVIEAIAPGAAVAAIATGLRQVVIDGAQMSGNVTSGSAIHLSRVTAGGLIVANDGAEIRGSIRDSALTSLDTSACDGCNSWRVIDVDVRGGDSVIGHRWQIERLRFDGGTFEISQNTVYGLGTVRDSQLSGRLVYLNGYSVYDSQFTTSLGYTQLGADNREVDAGGNCVNGRFPFVVARNRFSGGLSLVGSNCTEFSGTFQGNTMSDPGEICASTAACHLVVVDVTGNHFDNIALGMLHADVFRANDWTNASDLVQPVLRTRAAEANRIVMPRLAIGPSQANPPVPNLRSTISSNRIAANLTIMSGMPSDSCMDVDFIGNSVLGELFISEYDRSNQNRGCTGNPDFVGNAIISGGLGAPGLSEGAVRFNDWVSDPVLFKNNAFVGFGDGTLYLNEGDTPLSRIAQVNALADLPACGRGGNIALPTVDEARFLSLDPESPDFLRPGPGSPLINAGLALPYVCNNTTYDDGPNATDYEGNPRVCGGARDIGAYESCP